MSKNAIITGGSRGIGRAMALKLGEMGYNVVLNYVSESSKAKADAVAAEIEKNGVETLIVQADVSKPEDCKKIVDAAVDRFGDKIDALVNNAGIMRKGLVHEMSLEDMRAVVDTDLMGEVMMCHYAVPYMLHGGTNIVNVASMGGMTATAPTCALYGAAKGGVIMLTRCMAFDYAKCGIRVNSISPGVVDTDIISSREPAFLDAVISKIPVGRLGDPAEIGHTLEYILTNEFLTGQNLAPNGGQIMM